MLGVVFPRSLQVPWVGKDFLNLLMMRGITRFSWWLLHSPLSGYADKAGGATDYPDFDSSTDAREATTGGRGRSTRLRREKRRNSV